MTQAHIMMKRCSLFLLVLALAGGLSAVPRANAQSVTILHRFGQPAMPFDGNVPEAALIQGTDGNYYGTTAQGGGSANAGTVFKMTTSGIVTTIHSFGDGSVPNDGNTPRAALVQGADGNFYGTTEFGGTVDQGTVFKITPLGIVTVLHNFGDGSVANDGSHPISNLVIGSNQDFYGTTEDGGTEANPGYPQTGRGVVFEIGTNGGVTVLHRFGDGTVANDGNHPMADLTLGTNGNFYGTTAQGGASANTGTVFQMTPTGTVTILHKFGDGSISGDGTNPQSALVQASNGNFYGTTPTGGSAASGTVFRMTPAGAVLILHSFLDGTTMNDGKAPSDALIQGADGNLYGTTQTGGAANSGTVFRITTEGAVTTLHSFGDGTVTGDGILPATSLIQGTNGNFYGTTGNGGLGLDGAAFTMTAAGAVTILHSFAEVVPADEGSNPNAGLVQGTDGNFYGTTGQGGTAGNYGTIFKTTPLGVLTVLHRFGDGTVTNDGTTPEAGLVQGSDGNFYGTTSGGGSSNQGTVFKMTPAGAVTILHGFNGDPDGSDPFAGVILGSDGNFYGTTEGGGAVNQGTVYKITPGGTITILHRFGDGSVVNDGSIPFSPLVEGTDGDYYGTAQQGGTAGEGVVFKMTPVGSITILHSFTPENNLGVNMDGAGPVGGLAQGHDGNFYGTTSSGGTAGEGTIYKISSSGSLTVLHEFGDGSITNDGFGCDGLVQGTDGNFYGVTAAGGSTTVTDPNHYNGGSGTAFEMTPSGAVTILHDFGDGTIPDDGVEPIATLIQGSDGNFYGTTFGGGDIELGGGNFGQGTVFRLNAPVTAPVWNASDVASAPDGTARLLWTRSDGAAGLWIMSTTDNQSLIGPTYGPYSGWTAKAVAVAGGDLTSRLLWTRSDGAAGLWALDDQGVQISVGSTYGPYPGWTARDVATEDAGTSRILWTRSDGAASVWTMNATGTETLEGPTYGPYPGWTAKAVSAIADGTSRILWTRSDGAAGLWTLDSFDMLQTVGVTYGPFSDSHGTWSAQDLGTTDSGNSQVLWTRSDGAAGVWTFNATGTETIVGPIYGPYTGYGSDMAYMATALDTAETPYSTNYQTRVLWVRSDRAAGLWTFQIDDKASVIGSVYGPF